MELTPQQIRSTAFKVVRKGYDADAVDTFLGEVAGALESALQQSAAMEGRARAAVARLQEAAPAEPVRRTEPTSAEPELETISRTILLAQRTADAAVAEARDEAERIKAEAIEQSTRLIEEARAESRRVADRERELALNEVEALKARRDFLLGDVDQLEQFLVDQRERLRSAARQLESICERVPGGLGTMRMPILSASDDDDGSGDRDDDVVIALSSDVVDSPSPARASRLDETAELVLPPE